MAESPSDSHPGREPAAVADSPAVPQRGRKRGLAQNLTATPKAKFRRGKTTPALNHDKDQAGALVPASSSGALQRVASSLFAGRSSASGLLDESHIAASSSDTLQHMASSMQLGAPCRSKRDYKKVSVSVSNACVEFTREMLMEVMRDGEITETERRVLQVGVAVMSQIDGYFGNSKQRISVPVGTVQDMDKVFPACEEFMKKVAKDIDAHFEKQGGSTRKNWAQDDSVGTQLARAWVHFLEKCTGTDAKCEPEELLSCCERSDELDLRKEFGWFSAYILQALPHIMPDSYMFKERLAEIWTHRQHLTEGFAWRFLQFLLACLIYGFVKSWFALVATILQIRVVLCFASGLPLIGRFVYPFCTMAEKVFDWREDHWLLGCMEIDEKQSSLISVIPVWFSRNVMAVLLRRPEFVLSCAALLFCHWCKPIRLRRKRMLLCFLVFVAILGHALEFLMEEIPSAMLHSMFGSKSVRFAIESFLDFLFTTCLCSLDRNVLEVADDVIQPKLVLMSMKLGSLVKPRDNGK